MSEIEDWCLTFINGGQDAVGEQRCDVVEEPQRYAPHAAMRAVIEKHVRPLVAKAYHSGRVNYSNGGTTTPEDHAAAALSALLKE